MPVAPPEALTLDRIETPIGTALAVSDEAGVLRAFDWIEFEERVASHTKRRYAGACVVEGRGPLRGALSAYFDGDTRALAAVAWSAAGTEFQHQVWAALCTIPAGETISYAGLAARIGRPTAMRAVGLANGSNPIALVVPCHRVIGSDGSLTGYAGGLERKRWLLVHEGVDLRAVAA